MIFCIDRVLLLLKDLQPLTFSCDLFSRKPTLHPKASTNPLPLPRTKPLSTPPRTPHLLSPLPLSLPSSLHRPTPSFPSPLSLQQPSLSPDCIDKPNPKTLDSTESIQFKHTSPVPPPNGTHLHHDTTARVSDGRNGYNRAEYVYASCS